MNFAEPQWLVAFALIPIIYYLNIWSQKKKVTSAIKFSNLGLIRRAGGTDFSNRRNKVLFYVQMMILISVIFALANPQMVLLKKGQGVNVALVIDQSGSMQAEDYKPNRLEAAKVSAQVFVESLEPEDRAGIVVFSDGASTVSYLTDMRGRTVEDLKNIQLKQGRTAIGDGLTLSIDMVTSVLSDKKVIILLSDGKNNAGVVSPQEAIEFAKAKEIQVYTVGVGSDDNVVIGRDFYGRAVYAELDEEMLKTIAKETGGKYYRSVDENTLNDIYKQLSEVIERKNLESDTRLWFIMIALILGAVEFYLRNVKYRVLS
ncbi:MAG: VWA domain-containing protein [Candidatus Aenigmarchaeota archaeon]|nr:VWA domain-containing protein [Candidatus Aenigmarchaeota archaeon]